MRATLQREAFDCEAGIQGKASSALLQLLPAGGPLGTHSGRVCTHGRAARGRIAVAASWHKFAHLRHQKSPLLPTSSPDTHHQPPPPIPFRPSGRWPLAFCSIPSQLLCCNVAVNCLHDNVGAPTRLQRPALTRGSRCKACHLGRSCSPGAPSHRRTRCGRSLSCNVRAESSSSVFGMKYHNRPTVNARKGRGEKGRNRVRRIVDMWPAARRAGAAAPTAGQPRSPSPRLVHTRACKPVH